MGHRDASVLPREPQVLFLRDQALGLIPLLLSAHSSTPAHAVGKFSNSLSLLSGLILYNFRRLHGFNLRALDRRQNVVVYPILYYLILYSLFSILGNKVFFFFRTRNEVARATITPPNSLTADMYRSKVTYCIPFKKIENRE